MAKVPSENVLDSDPAIWRTVLQSLRGESRDYTSGKLGRAVILLAVPMVLEMLMESIFALADVFWVSRLGNEAVAVVGIAESIMTVVYAISIGLSMAGAAVVARRVGEKDREGAAEAAVQVILLGLVVSAVVGILGSWFALDLLRLAGADESVGAMGANYARIMLGGNATALLIFLINAVFRGAGDAAIAMRTLWLANAINIVLGPCFVFGLGPFPALGVTGAAVATNIGRGCGVIYQLYFLTRRDGRFQLGLRHLRLKPLVMLGIAKIGASGVVQNLVNTASWIGLVKIIAQFGSVALAGYTIAVRMVIFAILPAWGLSNAGATLVGQNLGAGQPARAESAVWYAVRYNVLFLGIVGAFFIVAANPIMHLFTQDPQTFEYGVRALRIIALGFPCFAAGLCWTSAFNGAGDTLTPTILNFFCFWVCEVPLAWLLADHFRAGPTGAFCAIPIAFTILAVAGTVLFKQGRWKLRKV
jgi:putative MATE family efflux protein